MSNVLQYSPLRRLVWMTTALFLSYLAVAMAMPAVAVHVSHTLGMGNVASGLAVGIAFLSTILSRGWAGRLADERGGKSGMFRGLALYALAALLCLASSLPMLGHGMVSYALLLAGRLLLGLGESLALVGMLAWSMAMMGPARSGLVMAVFGMGMYGAFAAGGPLGLWLLQERGFPGLMAICIALPLLGALMLWPLAPAVPAQAGRRPPFAQVLGRIWRPGVVVGLQGIGFAALGAFFPLYFLAQGWEGAGYGLTCFGLGFVAVRILFGSLPDRIGGVPVALASLLVEAVGQALLWLAPGPEVAMAGALLTGMGCSMVFPAMGLEAVRRVPMHLRGTAIGGFAAFQDLAYGVTGPLAGWIADHFGHAQVFLVGGMAAALGAAITMRLRDGGPASTSRAGPAR
ncbi:arabinose transporter [Pigmentiphaga sp.]|uniref:arabinose transporter n=1 Tax=Pigmentiphaga sp. TaxID=1977564 RepID=UPI00128BBB14|nr:arabinose transporter [Pigmentiphaga sp.]MPS26255.1 MFS transporter [Alcaligenaceae bacterium SAGV5]MPS53237.1 MFS transporter [Alcaligenaceae bacterium SAGV3]MPT57715.1 MFS transporter [Alcaligenaceae bacterium]